MSAESAPIAQAIQATPEQVGHKVSLPLSVLLFLPTHVDLIDSSSPLLHLTDYRFTAGCI